MCSYESGPRFNCLERLGRSNRRRIGSERTICCRVSAFSFQNRYRRWSSCRRCSSRRDLPVKLVFDRSWIARQRIVFQRRRNCSHPMSCRRSYHCIPSFPRDTRICHSCTECPYTISTSAITSGTAGEIIDPLVNTNDLRVARGTHQGHLGATRACNRSSLQRNCICHGRIRDWRYRQTLARSMSNPAGKAFSDSPVTSSSLHNDIVANGFFDKPVARCASRGPCVRIVWPNLA